jgi:hypothetical protein
MSQTNTPCTPCLGTVEPTTSNISNESLPIIKHTNNYVTISEVNVAALPTITHLQNAVSAITVANNCVTETVEEVTEKCSCDKTKVEVKCSSPKLNVSKSLDATTLNTSWLKAKPVDKIVLFGRDGNKLARFCKSGYVFNNEDGTAEVIENPTLKTETLAHTFTVGAKNISSILGDPLTTPYDTVADENGKVYLQKGLSSGDSIKVWNASEGVFEHRLVSDLAGVENNISDIECLLKQLTGEGIVYTKKINVGEIDPCGNPVTEEKIVLAYTPFPIVPEGECRIPIYRSTGLTFEDPASCQDLVGPAGEKGEKGDKGDRGEKGYTGPRGGTFCPGEGQCASVEEIESLQLRIEILESLTTQ